MNKIIKKKLNFNIFEILAITFLFFDLAIEVYQWYDTYQWYKLNHLIIILMVVSIILWLLSFIKFKQKIIPVIPSTPPYIKPTICYECINFYHHNCIHVPLPHTHERITFVNGIEKKLGYYPCDIINCFGTLPNGRNDIRN